jgi:hypothetical protein
MNLADVESLLKPCPFCGGKATALMINANKTEKTYWTVGCAVSKCRGGHSATAGPVLETEIAEWNHRPAEQLDDLSIYKRAMESMAAQFIHPKMTAHELAEMQLKGTK